MTFIQFSASEMLRDSVVDPAWYVLNIDAHRTWTPTKAGDSNNCHFDCTIECNADDGSTTFSGVPIVLQFNDKPAASGFIRGFLRALGVDIKPDTRYDLNAAVGQKIEAFIENDTWQGRMNNKANHKYRISRG